MKKKFAEKWLNGFLGILVLLSLALFFRQLSALRGERPVVEIVAPPSPTEARSAGRSSGNPASPSRTSREKDSSEAEITGSDRIDLNTAPLETLTGLPGIGPKLAEAMIRHRSEHGPFTCFDDLLEVPGIGEKRAEQIRPHVLPLAGGTAVERNGIPVSKKNRATPGQRCPRCGAALSPTHSRDPHYKPYCPNCLYYLRNSDAARNDASPTGHT